MGVTYSDTGATFSPDARYRYTLRRAWGSGDGPTVAFVGLNPSTADHKVDDPTIRRCVGFARSWGFHRMEMLNLFAYRATDPDELLSAADPVGIANDSALARGAEKADLVVAAWGAHRMARGRAAAVCEILGDFTVLGVTKEGYPRHPLYLRSTCRPLNPLTLEPVR